MAEAGESSLLTAKTGVGNIKPAVPQGKYTCTARTIPIRQ